MRLDLECRWFAKGSFFKKFKGQIWKINHDLEKSIEARDSLDLCISIWNSKRFLKNGFRIKSKFDLDFIWDQICTFL